MKRRIRKPPLFTRKVPDRPAGTRLFVPGFNDDATQFKVDQGNLGIAPLVAVAAAKPLLSKIHIGPKFTKANHVQRFIQADGSGNIGLAQQLVDQAYAHTTQSIPDRQDWINILNQMYTAASPGLKAYIDQKRGVSTTPPSQLPQQPSGPPSAIPMPPVQLPGGGNALPGGDQTQTQPTQTQPTIQEAGMFGNLGKMTPILLLTALGFALFGGRKRGA